MPVYTHTTKNIARPAMASVSNKQKMLMQSLTHFFTAPRHHTPRFHSSPTSITALNSPKSLASSKSPKSPKSPKSSKSSKSPKSPKSGGTHSSTNTNPYIDQLLQHVSKGAPISLRVIDWFVTNYSREYDISYVLPHTGRRFNVHESYKSQLKAYSKRQFDPFCRRNRIHFYYREDAMMQTTVGQLNFFRWAIENNVLEYIQTHLPEIEKAMRAFVRAQREEKREHIGGGGKNGGGCSGDGVHGGGGDVGRKNKTRRRGPVSPPSGGKQGHPGSLVDMSGGGGCGSAVHKGYIYTHRAPVTVDFS